MFSMVLRPLGKAILPLLLILTHQANSLKQRQKHAASTKVHPKSYYLNLQVDPDEKTFMGDVVITVGWSDRANEITLNAHKNLTVENVEVLCLPHHSESRGELVILSKSEKQQETDLYNIVLERYLDTGAECAIKLNFSGKLNIDGTKGLFFKPYADATTEQPKWIIGTEFKPSYASTVFPCFDDPALKVPIEVSIRHPSNLSSLSTMPLTSSENLGNGWTKDTFTRSPPMSTFSLAIFISDLRPVEYHQDGVQIGIWSAPEVLLSIKINTSEAIFSTLRTLSEYFGVSYPLPKIDYIALPESAKVNVNSTWGLIVASNSNLQLQPNQEKWIVGSKITGQWMGNLVTASSWDEEKKITALIGFSSALNNARNLAGQDSYVDVEWPMTGIYSNYYELGNPVPSVQAEIREYASEVKAQMVYRMLTYTLTKRTYSAALQNFMRRRQFKTFTIDEFWDALTKQAHSDGNLPNDLTINDIVMSWIEPYRLPFVSVTRYYNTSSALLTQQPFLRRRPKTALKDEAILWKIPILYLTQGQLDFTNTKASYWMISRHLNIKNMGDQNQFIIVNPEEIAPYVVNYDEANWNLLAIFLQSNERNKIPVITRAKLIHDALNLAYAGYLNFGVALNVTLYLKDERHLVAWRPFMNLFDHIGRYIDGTNARTKFEIYVRMLITPVYKYLTDNKAMLDKKSSQLMREMKGTLGDTGYEPILEEAKTEYSKWMNDSSIGYESVSKHFCTIFKYGTKEQWEFGFKTLTNELQKKGQISNKYLWIALVGCPKDHWKIKEILNWVIFEQNNFFNDEDIYYVFVQLTGRTDGYMSTFEYLKDNWGELKARFNGTQGVWKQLIHTATNLYKNEEGLEKVSALYFQHHGQFGEAEEIIRNSLIKIKEEVLWTEQHLKNLEDWLDNYIGTHSLVN